MELSGKHVVVVGLGVRTGVALVKDLCARGALVRAYDRKPKAELRANVEALRGLKFELEAGLDEPSALAGSDLILISPGVPADLPYLLKARDGGIPVWSEVEFASRLITAPLVAVTGSSGKSTTTALIGHILRAWDKKTFVGGNLGTPLIKAVHQADDFVVAEISSFQLEAVDEFHPRVGVLTNLYPNHLDRHGTMENYVGMKARLFARMSGKDVAVMNADQEAVRALAAQVKAEIRWFSTDLRNGKGAIAASDRIRFDGGSAVSLRNFSLLGRHNAENAVAAVVAADALGCPRPIIEKALGTFRALPHRLEPVAEFSGVTFINDSKSTTPDSAIVALEAFDRPILLLVGGRSKGAPYDALGRKAEGRVRQAVLFGEAAPIMEEAFKNVPHVICPNLASALKRAAAEARPGDVVLLSPANTSFDEFRDFEERGDAFRAWARARAREGL
ncbi:MAG: UDP-N-acetylmuramoyl-L-alanine--D-glutamate ligase [Pseudomonadota bacterium]